MGAPRAQIITEDRASGAQVIDGSLRLAEGDGTYTPYLKRTNSSTGNRRTWTFSGWVKRARVDNSQTSTIINYANTSTSSSGIEFGSPANTGYDNKLRFNSFSSGNNMDLWSAQLLRDTSAWYHIMQVYDTTQSTDSNRVKMYINGEHITDYAAASYPGNRWPDQWAEGPFCYAGSPGGFIGSYHWSGSDASWKGNFYASQFYLLDGQALGPENFGFTDPLTGVWRPKKYEVKAPNRIGKFFSANYAASDSFQANAPKLAAFDGSLTSRSACSSSGCTVTVSSIGVEVKRGLRVYAGYGSASVNGGTAVDFSGSAVGWQNLSFTGTLNTLAVTGDNTSNPNAGEIYAIEVDGVILVDNGGYGTTGFYLPFDGSAPIGQDQSGSGNNWTPMCLGNSVSLDNPIVSGATPILNTIEGGRVAVPGVRGSVGVAVTVYNSGSGNKYYLDGEEAKTLSYKRGQTVTFDTSDSTVSGHPFRFATAADAAGSTEYTTGSVTGASEGSAGAATTITIPTTAPENLYYYCTNHSGMGGSIAGIATDWRVADPYASYCKLAIPHAGRIKDYVSSVNTGTTSLMSTFSDNNSTYTGSPTLGCGSYYGNALFCNSTSDYPRINFNAGSFNFLHNQDGSATVEMWMFQYGYSTEGYILSDSAGSNEVGMMLVMGGDNQVVCYIAKGTSGSTYNSGNASVPRNRWHHIAITKEKVGSNVHLKIYIDGILGNSNTTITASDLSNSNSSNNFFQTGSPIGHEGSRGFTNFYMSDLRIYEGVKYTSDFVPGAISPDILPDNPSGVSYSSELTKSSAGSASFGGNDSFLNVPNNSGGDLTLGTGDFTIEFFVYLKSLGSSGTVFIDWRYTAQGVYPVIWQDGSGLYYHTNSSNRITSNSIPYDAWTHVAVSRSGTTTKMFLDGVYQGTFSDGHDYLAPPSGVWIGSMNRAFSSSYALQDGFMSNVRVIKGTALYTSDFTPPSTPLTNLTNTKILCCQSNSSAITASVAPDATGSASFNLPLSSTPFADSSSNTYTVTNTGSVTTASAGTNNFNITNAASFDGSSQRLNMNSNVTLINAWTIDAWIKLDSSASGYNAIYNSGYTSSNNTYIYMAVNDDEKPYLEGGSAGGTTAATNAINKNQWYHFRAIQIPGEGIHLYVDGEKVVTHGQNTTDMSSLGTDCIGSLISNGNNANNFHGLIGPVRYVGANLGPPPVGGLPTTAGALSNTPDLPIGLGGQAGASLFNPFDDNIDIVRGKETQYGTWNPLMKNSNVTLTEGNLVAKCTQNAWRSSYVDIGTKGGKWYFEMTTEWIGNKAWIGICPTSELEVCRDTHVSNSANSYAGRVGDGIYRNNSSNQSAATGPKFPMVISGVAMCAYDLDNGKFWVGSDGIWWQTSGGDIPDPATGTGAGYTGLDINLTYHAAAGIDQYQWKLNCGQTPFKYPPPEGFNAICNANLPSPGVTVPSNYIKPQTYIGTGGTNVIDCGFKPDLVICKSTSHGYDWGWWDTVRSRSGNVYDFLKSNSDDTQSTGGTTSLQSYNDKGFTLGADAAFNQNSVAFCSWNLKAGGNKNTFNVDDIGFASFAASGTTAGSITPTGTSIGTKQGFSIIQYEGTGSAGTIPHGLLEAPTFVIIKDLDTNYSWVVGHEGIGWSNVLKLEGTDAALDRTYFNDTAPTNTVVSVSGENSTNKSGDTYIMYSWAPREGVQKFGKYIGSGNDDGTCVYLGFRPAIVWVKCTSDSGQEWVVWDKSRAPYNEITAALYLDDTTSESSVGTTRKVDFLSNGFKLRNGSSGATDYDARTYIYMAWADQPAHNLYGGQSNAR